MKAQRSHHGVHLQDGRPSVVPAALQPRVSASMGLVHVSAAAMRRLVPFLLTEREGIKQCPRVMIGGGGEAAAAGVIFCSTQAAVRASRRVDFAPFQRNFLTPPCELPARGGQFDVLDLYTG